MRLLVVEDYPVTRDAVVRGLAEEGFAVDSVGTAREALWACDGTVYDIIILDLSLPDGDGLAVLTELRARGNPSHVLILTARDGVGERVRGLNSGADDYLVKPFAFEELVARIQALARRTGTGKDPILRVADLTVDTRTRQAERGGHLIALSRREYALLEHLARRPAEVVSREHIRHHIYDFSSDAKSNVIDVYVGYLRRKLEPPGSTRILHTHRGHGYRLGGAP